MVNEDILGGIETGVAKGQSIESVMIGFFNAGYPREDIEWAAKSFQLNQSKINAGNTIQLPEVPKKESKFLSFFKSKKKEQPVVMQPFVKKPILKQSVSAYDQASEFREKVILLVLVSSLIILLAILAAVFLFKEQLANFINSLFGT